MAKTFNGKLYGLEGHFTTKTQAKKQAERIKKMGGYARVLREKRRGKVVYVVYGR